MKKLLLIFCLLVVGGGAFADIEPWQFNVHLSEDGWREKLEADIKKYPQVKFLELPPPPRAIPELPEHDFNNIVQSIGGYISTNNMEGLKDYYSGLMEDCKKVNNQF